MIKYHSVHRNSLMLIISILVAVLLQSTATISVGYASTVGTTDASANSDGISSLIPRRTLTSDAVSGVPAKETLEVSIGTNASMPNETQFYGITAISIIEVSGNKPCHVQLFGSLLDPAFQGSGRLLGKGKIPGCKEATAYSDGRMASFNDRKNRFARGVNVCTEGGGLSPGYELKGLKIFPAEVKSTGQVVKRDHPAGFDRPRPNCKFWNEPSMCDTGWIMVGVEMHYVGKEFTGIIPLCKSVKGMPSPAGFPKKDNIGY